MAITTWRKRQEATSNAYDIALCVLGVSVVFMVGCLTPSAYVIASYQVTKGYEQYNCSLPVGAVVTQTRLGRGLQASVPVLVHGDNSSRVSAVLVYPPVHGRPYSIVSAMNYHELWQEFISLLPVGSPDAVFTCFFNSKPTSARVERGIRAHYDKYYMAGWIVLAILGLFCALVAVCTVGFMGGLYIFTMWCQRTQKVVIDAHFSEV